VRVANCCLQEHEQTNTRTPKRDNPFPLVCSLLGARISPLGDSFARSSSAEASFAVSLAAICSSKEGALLMYTPTPSSTGKCKRVADCRGISPNRGCNGHRPTYTVPQEMCTVALTSRSSFFLSWFLSSFRNGKYLASVSPRLLYGAAMARFNPTDRPIALDYNLVFSIVSYFIVTSTRRVRISSLYGGKGHRDRVALEKGSLAREFRSFFFPFSFFFLTLQLSPPSPPAPR